MDTPTLFSGRDKRVPPNLCRRRDRQVPAAQRSEGHACHARRDGMDTPTLFSGRDERVPPSSGPDEQLPPSGRDKRVPPKSRLGF
jgi:hypothetical protein